MKTLIPSVFLALILAVALPATVLAQDNGLEVEVSADQSTISRGSEQTLNIETSEEADIIGMVAYASTHDRWFSGTTDDEGNFAYEWRIGGNSNPGTFDVTVIALTDDDGAKATTTFEVTTAQPEEGEGEEPIPPVDNGTISEGNGTVIVPEEPVPIGNETVPAPVSNETAPPEVPETPTVNETIPVPVPINSTTGNETIPVPIPINTTTGNETIPVPELPTNDTVIVPVEPFPTENQNQTETLPEEIPAANETTTVPIPIPINQTTGNETIPVPEIPVVNETAPAEPEPPIVCVQAPCDPETGEPLPVGNETAPPTGNQTTEPEPEEPPVITPETPPEDVISVLEDRVEAVENQSATQEEVFVAAGEAIQDLADAVATLPIFPDQRDEIITSMQELNEAIADLG